MCLYDVQTADCVGPNPRSANPMEPLRQMGPSCAESGRGMRLKAELIKAWLGG